MKVAPEAKPAAIQVLHLIESDGVYGAEHVVLALAGQAASDPRFSASIGCLVTQAPEPNRLLQSARELGVPAHEFAMRKVQSAYDVASLPGKLRRLRVGLIHAHGYKAAIAGYAAHLATGIPILATCHLWFEDSAFKWTYRWLTRLERRLYPRFDHVVAVSQQIAECLRASGVPPSRLTEIENGIPTVDKRPQSVREAIRRDVGADSDTFVVVNVGRLVEQKAQADLVSAAALLRDRHRNVLVLILGDGHLRAALDDQIRMAGLSDRVRVLGFQDDVQGYLSIADVFVLPSVDEGLPIALLEALMAGVPVICTPVGAIPEFLQHGVSALLVPARDPAALAAALERLIVQPDLRPELAQRGHDEAAQRFTAKTMYGRYREIYERLTTGAHGGDEPTRR